MSSHPKRKAPSLKAAIEWIALNDDPGSSTAENLEAVSEMISVLLAADLFGVEPEKIAERVVKLRLKGRTS